MQDCSDLIDLLFAGIKQKNWKLATAESCTGGMIAATITDKSGSSAILERGFVTYSNQAKIDCLHVSEATLTEHGAVSAQTAREMAVGALKNSLADISISVTGIAGPDGGTEIKPVGLVYIGCCVKNSVPEAHQFYFDGDRASVRRQTMYESFKILLTQI